MVFIIPWTLLLFCLCVTSSTLLLWVWVLQLTLNSQASWERRRKYGEWMSSNFTSNNKVFFHLGSIASSPCNKFKGIKNGNFSDGCTSTPRQMAEQVQLASWAALCSAQSTQPHVAAWSLKKIKFYLIVQLFKLVVGVKNVLLGNKFTFQFNQINLKIFKIIEWYSTHNSTIFL